ncbi:MAG: hypothetical protein HXN08_06550, partial [Porphyromonadaceae bacterium]|nr:hypothetical protein [Porphyromonadaceae bacterium]
RVRTHLKADLRTTRTVLTQIAEEVAVAAKGVHRPAPELSTTQPTDPDSWQVAIHTQDL